MSQDTLNIAGHVSVDYCVASLQAELDNYSPKLHERIYALAIRYLAHLNISHSNKIDVAYFTMNSQGLVDFSELTDYVEYTKIGIPINGKLWILGKNNKILRRGDELSAAEALKIFNATETPVDTTEGYYFAPHYRNNVYVTALFGLGGGFSRSYYRVDEVNKLIQFDTVVPNSEIAFEYKSTGVKADGTSLMPRLAMEVIIARILWTLAKSDRSKSRGEKTDLKQDYTEALAEFDNHENSFTWEEFLNAMYKGSKQTPKR